ncbi:MAG: BrnA antitoxin family protein [Gammaproteobacteria bacterium]
MRGSLAAASRPSSCKSSQKHRNQRLYLRLSDELARWKATGPGWRTRMADLLGRAVRRRAA